MREKEIEIERDRTLIKNSKFFIREAVKNGSQLGGLLHIDMLFKLGIFVLIADSNRRCE